VTPIDTRYPESSQITDLWQTIEARLRALPGVTVAGGATQIPMGSGMTSQFSYRRDDRPPPEPGEFTVAQARTATPGFFEAIGLRLLRGRFPGASDGPGRQNVLVVSEALVREAFAGDDPIGRRLIIQETPQEIVGIVADVRTAGPWSEPAPMVWTN
jgi:putative ABC transport system permease protein